MDPATAFGVATAVVGLLPICANGCIFIEGLCHAKKGVQDQMIRIGAQRAVRCPAARTLVFVVSLTLYRC